MAYSRKYRSLRKEVDRWLESDNENFEPSVVSENRDLCASAEETSMAVDELDSLGTSKDCRSDSELSADEAPCRPPDDSDAAPVSSSDGDDLVKSLDDMNIESLQTDLAQWVVKTRLTRESSNRLCALLRKHGCALPKDHRTLIRSPAAVNILNKCGGQYVYFGLQKVLEAAYSETESEVLLLQVNVDGIPLYKSSNTQLWPILVSVNSLQPMIVALYLGTSKPSDVQDFLEDFVNEVRDLQQHGFKSASTENIASVTLHSVVCDAPARAFLKNIKGHNSLHACERCIAVGASVCGRTTYLDSSCFASEKRDCQKFTNVEYMGTHQNGPTPLSFLTDNCINICSLDYMHLVCLGVVRRMLHFWKNGDRDRTVKLSSRHILEISEKLVALRHFIPSNFARRPRSLVELDRWKATEFRQFLLYSGPVVLKSVLPPTLYKHFLTLSVAISILLTEDSEKRCSLLEYARQLLHHFVMNAERLYGATFLVYNVHNLLHLTDDVVYFGTCLDKCSAFRYENFLQSIKRLVRSCSSPLVQIVKRIQEYEAVNCKSFTVQSKPTHCKLTCSPRDSTVLLKNGKYADICEMKPDRFMCTVYKRRSLKPFYVEPCSSELLQVYFLSKHSLSTLEEITVDKVQSKAIKFPYENGFVVMPLLHEETN